MSPVIPILLTFLSHPKFFQTSSLCFCYSGRMSSPADHNHSYEAKNFREFWPQYLRAHSKPKTRMMHYLGTAVGVVVFGCLVYSYWSSVGVLILPLSFLGGLFSTYLFAVPSHAIFEGNRAKTLESLSKGGLQGFREIWWSILGDLLMSTLAFTGQLSRELDKLEEKDC